jgi:hypothetical protein
MEGVITSINGNNGSITTIEGDVFPFSLMGIADPGLSQALQQSPGNVPVRFAVQNGFAVQIRRA